MAVRAGRGEGATVVAMRLERLPESPQRLADAIVALDGVAAVQIGATDLARTSVPTIEKDLRKDEGIFAGLLIIEALDEAALGGALRRAAEMAPELFGGVGEPEAYQGMFALDARIADREEKNAVVLARRADRPRTRAACADRCRRGLRL